MMVVQLVAMKVASMVLRWVEAMEFLWVVQMVATKDSM
jgi:hypothetical protein